MNIRKKLTKRIQLNYLKKSGSPSPLKLPPILENEGNPDFMNTLKRKQEEKTIKTKRQKLEE